MMIKMMTIWEVAVLLVGQTEEGDREHTLNPSPAKHLPPDDHRTHRSLGVPEEDQGVHHLHSLLRLVLLRIPSPPLVPLWQPHRNDSIMHTR